MKFSRKLLHGVVVAALVKFGSLPASGATSHPYDIVEQFAQVLAVVEDSYVEPTAREKLGEGALIGMVGALDPHSAYMPPEEYLSFREETSGQFAGIGVEVDLRNGQVVIVAPIAGSPAERAGVIAGDRIAMVDGVPLDILPLPDIVRRMRGTKGTTVHLVIRRKGHPAPMRFNIVRDDVRLPSIYVRTFDSQVAYLRITVFQEGTHTELLEKMGGLRRLGPYQGIILDLRQNPGGLVAESIAVADEFLPKGPLFFTRHRGKIIEQVDTTGYGNFERVPLVTIVDAGTASAAEILAGALKDRKRSVLVGNRTFGKGTVQSIIDLPGGAGLRLTSLRYYTPFGFGIQATGIQPDQLTIASQDISSELVRESDLPGHLPSDGHIGPPQSNLPRGVAPPDSTQHSDSTQPCEVSKPIITLLERIRQLPQVPNDSSDEVLASAYRSLLAQLSRSN